MSNKERIYQLIMQGEDNKTICSLLKTSMRTVQRYRKEFKATYGSDTKTIKKISDKIEYKRRKEQAKALIATGATIRETAAQTGLATSTVSNISARYNLQAKQLELLKQFRDSQRELAIKNKLKRLKLNTTALQAIGYEIENWKDTGMISKGAMEKLILNEQAEQQILELDRIERMEKTEVEEKNETKLSEYLSILKQGLGGKNE